MFIPATINEKDFLGKHFGRYVVDVDPISRHACPAFDICTYNVGNGKFGSSVPFYRRLATIGSVGLKPIRLLGDIEPGTDTKWTILGYPNRPKHCRMTAVTGNQEKGT